MIEGIDVSNHQKQIDWETVSHSVSFAFIKATEGTVFRDWYFPYNWRTAARFGMYRGAYHFARPEDNGPTSEAKYFTQFVREQELAVGDMLVLDLESGNGNLAEWTYGFVDAIEQEFGIKPIIYTSPAFIREHGLADELRLAECGLWLASWGVTFPQPVEPWDLVAFWQYTDSGHVDGIATPVDRNRFNGPIEAIPLYGLTASDLDTDSDTNSFEYVRGFADIVERLGRDVVGEPLENEHAAVRSGHDVVHQLTSHGELVYWPTPNRCYFYPATYAE